MSESLDKLGRSELHYACNEGNLSKVKMLISEGYRINLPDNNGWTPLHFAAQSQSHETVLFLIENGADVDPRDNFGNTPLFRAVFSYKDDGATIQLLRKSNANPYLENNSGQSPLGLSRLISNNDVANFFKDLV